jgi:7-carboxy-7-deazaguanine synthase
VNARDRGDATTLVVNELYASVQGEGTRAGRPCTFVRLTGCGLRCSWCDTEYAFHEGERKTLDDVLAFVRARPIPLVQLTGGEPLEQPAAFELIRRLVSLGYEVVIETGGHVDTSGVDARAVCVVDVKCPGSAMEKRNLWSNLSRLRPQDEVKFVVRDRTDFDYALGKIREHALDEKGVPLLFSPVHGVLAAATLAQWLVEEGPRNARLNLQQHKYIWPEAARGV